MCRTVTSETVLALASWHRMAGPIQAWLGRPRWLDRRNRYSPRGSSSPQMCRANHSQLCTIAASRSRGFVIPWPNPL